MATLLSAQPMPRGRRVALLTNAGGLGILCADACEAAGLELPPLGEGTIRAIAALLPEEASLANPVDMLGSASEASYECPAAAAGRSRRRPVIALFVPAVSASADGVAAAIARAAAASSHEKPVLAVVMSAGGIPAALRQDTEPPLPSRSGVRRPGARSRRRAGRLAEAATRLRAVAPRRRPRGCARRRRARALAVGRPLAGSCRSARAAGGIRDSVGPGSCRVYLWGSRGGCRIARLPRRREVRRGGAHKTETGGIALDLSSADAVRAATDRIGAPVVVQPMIVGGTELLAGLVQDPVFGPLVAFGPVASSPSSSDRLPSGSRRSRTSMPESRVGSKAGPPRARLSRRAGRRRRGSRRPRAQALPPWGRRPRGRRAPT